MQLPVLDRRIPRGEIIRSSDLTWMEIPVKRLRHNTLLSADKVIGKAAKRLIGAGVAISAHDVENPILVEKGKMVTIAYRTEYMEVKTLAQALEDGTEGSVIRVKNIDSGSELKAYVRADGELVVNYIDALQQEQQSASLDKTSG